MNIKFVLMLLILFVASKSLIYSQETILLDKDNNLESILPEVSPKQLNLKEEDIKEQLDKLTDQCNVQFQQINQLQQIQLPDEQNLEQQRKILLDINKTLMQCEQNLLLNPELSLSMRNQHLQNAHDLFLARQNLVPPYEKYGYIAHEKIHSRILRQRTTCLSGDVKVVDFNEIHEKGRTDTTIRIMSIHDSNGDVLFEFHKNEVDDSHNEQP